MTIVGFFKRLYKFVRRKVLTRLRIDPVSGMRIFPRGTMQRLGRQNAGWFVPIERLKGASVCYCVGCGEDISFDLALIELTGCEVWAYDPTPRAIEHVARVASGNSSYHFVPVGVWSSDTTLKFYAPADSAAVSHSVLNLQQTSDYFVAQVNRLSALMAGNGHHKIDLLKLDVEGAEYEIIETLLADRIVPDILCIEFDEYFNPLDQDYRIRISKSLHKLRSMGMEIVHTPGNGNYTLVRV
jgi:FkbM family methyltransferase